MDVYDADGYKQWVRRMLERLSPALTIQLRTILSHRFHPRVVLLDIEVFPGGLGKGIPMRMFLIDEHNGETFHDDPAYFFPSSIGMLEEITAVIARHEADRQQRYQDAGVDTMEMEMAALVEWFAECWIRAGGQQCRLPAYICYHDGGESFDLKQMRWEANVNGKWTHLAQK